MRSKIRAAYADQCKSYAVWKSTSARVYFTKSYLGEDAADLAPSSGDVKS